MSMARVAMTANRQVLRDIGHSRGPVKSLFALGYAGWGPGQLEGRGLARHDWFTTPAEPRLIFDDGPRQSVGRGDGAPHPRFIG